MEYIIKLIKNYFNYKNLGNFFEDERKHGGLKESFILVFFAQLISFLSVSIGVILGYTLDPSVGVLLNTEGIIVFLFMALIGVPFFYVFSAAIFALSKLLDGKGGFAEQAYLFAVIALASTTISFPVGLFSYTLLALPAGIIGLLLSVYMIYTQFKCIQALHKLPGIKTAIVLIGFWTFMIVFMVLVILATMPIPVPLSP